MKGICHSKFLLPLFAALTVHLLLLPFSFSDALAQDSTKKHFLDLKGTIKYGKKKLPGVTLTVFVDTFKLFNTYETDSLWKGICILPLPLEKYYIINVSKPGYVAKIVTADTHTPKVIKGDYLFEFTVDLFEEIPELDVSMLKDPIAKITYNTFTKKFEYDYNYTAKINNDVKALYRDYYLLKKKGKKFIAPVAKPDTVSMAKTILPDTSGAITQHPASILPDTSHAVSAPVSSTDSVKKTDGIVSPKEIVSPKIIFSVQVVVSSTKQKSSFSKLKELTGVQEYMHSGLYKYRTGEFSSYTDARKLREDILKYFPDAFVISFKDGQRINVSDAIDLQYKFSDIQQR